MRLVPRRPAEVVVMGVDHDEVLRKPSSPAFTSAVPARRPSNLVAIPISRWSRIRVVYAHSILA
jgi:hypothetical protein